MQIYTTYKSSCFAFNWSDFIINNILNGRKKKSVKTYNDNLINNSNQPSPSINMCLVALIPI